MTPSVATVPAPHAREERSPRRSPVAEVLKSIRFATRVARSFDETRHHRAAAMVPSSLSTVHCVSPAKSCSNVVLDAKSMFLTLTSELGTPSHSSNESIAAVPARAHWPSKLSSETDSGGVNPAESAALAGALTPGSHRAPVDTSWAAQRVRSAFMEMRQTPRDADSSSDARAASKLSAPEGRGTASALVELQTAIAILREDFTPIPVHKFIPPIKVSLYFACTDVHRAEHWLPSAASPSVVPHCQRERSSTYVAVRDVGTRESGHV